MQSFSHKRLRVRRQCQPKRVRRQIVRATYKSILLLIFSFKSIGFYFLWIKCLVVWHTANRQAIQFNRIVFRRYFVLTWHISMSFGLFVTAFGRISCAVTRHSDTKPMNIHTLWCFCCCIYKPFDGSSQATPEVFGIMWKNDTVHVPCPVREVVVLMIMSAKHECNGCIHVEYSMFYGRLHAHRVFVSPRRGTRMGRKIRILKWEKEEQAVAIVATIRTHTVACIDLTTLRIATANHA